MLNFLDEQQQISMPTADFQPSGFVGACHAMMAFAFYATAAPDVVTNVECGVKPIMWRQQGDNGYRYYYGTALDADKVKKEIDPNLIVNQQFVLRMPLAQLLNVTDESKAKFKSDPMVFDVDVTTLRSKQSRHKFNFLFLPSIVSAYAAALGVKHTPWACPTELVDPDAVLNESIEEKLLGTASDYTTGALWQARKQLWHELGEDDATKCNPIPKDPANATKFDTTSPTLSKLLGIVAWKWTASVYVRLLNVQDPKEPKAGKERYSTPIILTIYPDEAAARKDAEEELARKSGGEEKAAPVAAQPAQAVKATPAPVAQPTNGEYPPLPKSWEGMTPDDFVPYLKEHATAPKPLALKKLEVTEAEYTAWMAWLNKQVPF